MRRARLTRTNLWVLSIFLVGCSERPAEVAQTDDVAAPDSAVQAAAPDSATLPQAVDLAGLMRRVHFAFRPEGDAFAGGHGTYGVRVGPGGRFELTPCRRPVEVEGAPRAAAERGAPLGLETVVVERGGTSLAQAGARVQVEADGSLAVARGAVVERLENGEDGVEQSWAFAAAPEGEGDLTVRVRPWGQAYVGRTEHGHHFADLATGLGFRYGLATWIDATGARTPVDVQVAAGDLVLTVPHDVLARSSFPAVLDPTVGPEQGVDQPILDNAPGKQALSRSAFDGANYLVVWPDERFGTDVFATRVTKAGAVLDPAGIHVTAEEVESFADTRVDVAFDGTNYLVVWTGVDAGVGDVLKGARISRAGALLDAPGFVIRDGPCIEPAVAFGGANYLVAFSRGGDIEATRVTPTKVVLDSPALALGSLGRAPDVAFDGSNYFVVWEAVTTTLDIVGRRVSQAGAVLDAPSGIVVDGATQRESTAPAVAFDGTNYLVVYADAPDNAPTEHDLAGKLVTTTGLVGSRLGISETGDDETTPAVAYDGTNYLVVWAANPFGDYGIFGARVAENGAVLDPTPVPIRDGLAQEGEPALAFDGTTYLVSYTTNEVSIQTDIRAARLNAAATVLDDDLLVSTTVANAQTEPAAASDGKNFLVVWRDTRFPVQSEIFGARVGPTGIVLDPLGIDLDLADVFDESHPAVAWNGSQYLVALQGFDADDNLLVAATRVTAQGLALDKADPIVLGGETGDALAPRVAGGAGQFLVVWQDRRSFDSYDVFGARVSNAGAVLDPDDIAISIGVQDQVEPDVAFGSKSFLVTWSDFRAGTGFSDIRAARVDKNGALLDGPAGNGGRAVSTAAFDQLAPAVGWSGSSFFVVWEDWRGGTGDIFGTAVSNVGVVASPAGVLVSGAASDQTRPAIAYHGKGFIATWEDRRAGGDAELFGARLTKAGAVQDAGGFLVADGDTDHRLPALAARSGQVLCVYQRFVPTMQEVRVLTRLIKP